LLGCNRSLLDPPAFGNLPGQIGEIGDQGYIVVAIGSGLVADAQDGNYALLAQNGHNQFAHKFGVTLRHTFAVRHRSEVVVDDRLPRTQSVGPDARLVDAVVQPFSVRGAKFAQRARGPGMERQRALVERNKVKEADRAGRQLTEQSSASWSNSSRLCVAALLQQVEAGQGEGPRRDGVP
jgi:hypothetical protein